MAIRLLSWAAMPDAAWLLAPSKAHFRDCHHIAHTTSVLVTVSSDGPHVRHRSIVTYQTEPRPAGLFLRRAPQGAAFSWPVPGALSLAYRRCKPGAWRRIY